MGVNLTREDIDALYMCRNVARSVAQIERRLNSPFSGGAYRSPSFTGMPKAHDPHGLDGSAGRNEAEFEKLESEKEKYEQCRETAQKVILKLDESMHDFCMAYFIRGEDLTDVQASTGMSESTCKRRLKDVRYFADNFRRQRTQMTRNDPVCTEMTRIAT